MRCSHGAALISRTGPRVSSHCAACCAPLFACRAACRSVLPTQSCGSPALCACTEHAVGWALLHQALCTTARARALSKPSARTPCSLLVHRVQPLAMLYTLARRKLLLRCGQNLDCPGIAQLPRSSCSPPLQPTNHCRHTRRLDSSAPFSRDRRDATAMTTHIELDGRLTVM